MKKFMPFFLICFLGYLSINAQVVKRPLTHDDIESWNRITEKIISNNGEWIVYKTEPWKGDTKLFICNSLGKEQDMYHCGTDAGFSYDSRFLLFKVTPEYKKMREMKLKKTEKEDMPGDRLVLYELEKKSAKVIGDIQRYALPGNWSGWLAYQTGPAKKNKGPEGEIVREKSNTVSEKSKSESEKNGYSLKLFNLESGDSLVFPFVTYFAFAEDERRILFASTGDEMEFLPGMYLYDLGKESLSAILEGKGMFKQVAISKDGSKIAFLADMENESGKGEYTLFFWQGSGLAKSIIDSSHPSLPADYILSENGQIRFDKDLSKIFFGDAPGMPEKDTTRLDDDYPNVDIWHGSEGKLHSVQVLDKGNDLKKNYTAVYHMDSGNLVQLGSPEIPDIQLINDGMSDWVLGLSNIPYELQSMWEGSPDHLDIYLINVNTGSRDLVKKDARASVKSSPAGKYIYWYNFVDSSYYTYNLKSHQEFRVTSPETVSAANELNDVPNLPPPYSPTGWLENDRGFLVNDRYDIWMVDPENRDAPVNLTQNGRPTKTNYRFIDFDREKDYIGINEQLLLAGQNEVTRESCYYSWRVDGPGIPQKLTGGQYNLSQPLKAKDANGVIYSYETFGLFPDLLVSDLSFARTTRISDANPQQKEFLWGSAELFSWTSLDGKRLEGLLYKPENFDPAKKYPMIVNFYERSSEELYNHRTPELHRSTVDYHYYTSNGYLVFNPDVVYEEGYPGESAFNCVMPAVTALIESGFVDEDHIGAQGHSWGGYQVAYLATRTDLFAAIESGAPVVNMFSAYGGIRWWTGLNRSFQYEHTQSRIGATIWESPLRYIENSPLFTMDKVTTPILIMHNDQDGHVPWYQGIEYFIALRRLQKPVWMLNYTGEPHWPQKLQNKKDFQIRLAQFFDHFLKEKPMPVWMKEGIPVIMKEHDLGYGLVEK